jgi:hypothetical protein
VSIDRDRKAVDAQRYRRSDREGDEVFDSCAVQTDVDELRRIRVEANIERRIEVETLNAAIFFDVRIVIVRAFTTNDANRSARITAC